ncbi:hypothetical protein EMIT0111MI5_30216 [Burkholderia sp. IT-111MI5]
MRIDRAADRAIRYETGHDAGMPDGDVALADRGDYLRRRIRQRQQQLAARVGVGRRQADDDPFVTRDGIEKRIVELLARRQRNIEHDADRAGEAIDQLGVRGR